MSDWLVDWQILEAMERDALVITNFSLGQLQGHSYDVRLGNQLVDPATDEMWNIPAEGYPLTKHEFLLGTTMETFSLPPNIVGELKGKSTRARQGLTIEAAGLLDGGWGGEITLELNDQCSKPVLLEVGMRIGQVVFIRTETPQHPYGHPALNSHYQGQHGPTTARGI